MGFSESCLEEISTSPFGKSFVAIGLKGAKNLAGWPEMTKTNICGLAISLLLSTSALADDEPGRNESSVPRNSVLPFSPAIAVGQNEDSSILMAKLALHRKGYEVGSIDGFISARYVASLVYFQRDYGLPETGKLDIPTRKALEIPQ